MINWLLKILIPVTRADQAPSDFNSATNGSNSLTDTAIKLQLPGGLTSNATGTLNTIVNILFAFIALMAFFGILYSGYMYITAGGDTAKAATARKNLMWSIIGIILVSIAYLVVVFIYRLIGGSPLGGR